VNFFNIGPMELVVIFLLALIVFGPRRLPEIARDLGKAVRQFKQASQELTTELGVELDADTLLGLADEDASSDAADSPAEDTSAHER